MELKVMNTWILCKICMLKFHIWGLSAITRVLIISPITKTGMHHHHVLPLYLCWICEFSIIIIDLTLCLTLNLNLTIPCFILLTTNLYILFHFQPKFTLLALLQKLRPLSIGWRQILLQLIKIELKGLGLFSSLITQYTVLLQALTVPLKLLLLEMVLLTPIIKLGVELKISCWSIKLISIWGMYKTYYIVTSLNFIILVAMYIIMKEHTPFQKTDVSLPLIIMHLAFFK